MKIAQVLTAVAVTAVFATLAATANAQFSVGGLKRIDPTNKNSDVRKSARKFDQHRLGWNRRPADSGYTLPAFSSGPTRVYLVNNTGRTQTFRIHFRGNNANAQSNRFVWKTVGAGQTVTFSFSKLNGLQRNGSLYKVWAENNRGQRWGASSGGLNGRGWTTTYKPQGDITSGTIIHHYRFALR